MCALTDDSVAKEKLSALRDADERQIQKEVESLIMAQIERWRHA